MALHTNDFADDTFVENTYVQKYGHPYKSNTHGFLSDTSTVLAIPLPVASRTQKGPYAKGSIAWSQFDETYQHTSKFKTMLQLFAHGLEMPDIGCPTFTGDPGSDAVRMQQQAFIRTLEGRSKQWDYKKLAKIQHKYLFDPVVADAIVGIVQGRFDDQIPRAGQNPNGPNRRADGDNLDEIADGIEMDRAAMAGGGGGRGRRGRHHDDDGDEVDIQIDPDDETDLAIRNVLDDLCHGEGRDFKEKIEVVVVNMRRPAYIENDQGKLERKRVPKLDDAGMPIHGEELVDDNGDPVLDQQSGEPQREVLEEDAWEDAGCIIFFCVLDPMYSVGKMVQRLIALSEEHQRIRTGVQSAAFGGGDSSAMQSSGGGPGQGGGPGRGPGQQGSSKISNLVRIFPWLQDEEHRDNTLHTLSFEKYLDLVSFVRDDPTLKTTKRNNVEGRGLEHPGTADDPNPLAPVNVFTVEWACKVMSHYGVPASECSPHHFFPPNGQARRPGDAAEEAEADELNLDDLPDLAPERDDEDDDNAEAENQVVPFHTGANKISVQFPSHWSYHYLQRAFVWCRNGYHGLWRQLKPWVRLPAPLQKLSRATNASGGQELALYEGVNARNTLSRKYTRQIIQEGQGVCEPLPVAPYDPFAIQRRDAIRAIGVSNAILMADACIPMTLTDQSDLAAWNSRCLVVRQYRLAAIQRVQQILTPSSSISPSMKTIMAYMAKNVRRMSDHLPHITWNREMWQAKVATQELDSFSHKMLREALDVRWHRHIVSQIRHWQIVHHGAMDCYRTGDDVDIHISGIFHGMSQTGKSFLVKDATVKTCIPNTVVTQLQSSDKSTFVHHDITGLIVFKDEVEDIIVSQKAAERDKTGKAEREKSIMTDQKATYTVLIYTETKANGRQKREQEHIETRVHVSTWCCTNKKVGGGDEALASRFLNFTATRHDSVNLYEFMGLKEKIDEVDKRILEDIVKSMRVDQCFQAIMNAMIDGKALPQVSMDVFDLVMSRMLSYMDKHGVDTKEIRCVMMARNLARVYTILNCKLMLYDVPGAPYAGREFEMDQLIDAVPYMYCTKQIAIFAITQLSEMFVHPIRDVVMRAVLKTAGFPYTEGYRVEDYVKEDVEIKLPWLTIDEKNNPVEVTGQDGISNSLVRVPRGGRDSDGQDDPTAVVKPQTDYFYDFNYVILRGKYDELKRLIAQNTTGIKAGPEQVDSCIDALTKNVFIEVDPYVRQSMKHFRDERMHDIPFRPIRKGKKERIPAIKREFGNGYIAVALEAIGRLDESLLIEAVGSCIYDGFRPQQILLGIHPEELICFPNGEERIHQYSGLYMSLNMSPENKVIFSTGEKFTTPEVTCLNPTLRKMTVGPSRDPDKAVEKKNDYTTEIMEGKTKRLKPVHEIEEDLDDWGCKVHHYRTYMMGVPEHSAGLQRNIFQVIRDRLRDDAGLSPEPRAPKKQQKQQQQHFGPDQGPPKDKEEAEDEAPDAIPESDDEEDAEGNGDVEDGEEDELNLDDLMDGRDGGRRRGKRSTTRSARRGRDSGRFSQKETDERRKFFSNLTTIDYPLDLMKEECAMLLSFEKSRASGDTSHVRSEVYQLLCENWKIEKAAAELANPGVPFKVPYPVDLTLTNLARNSVAFKISTGLAALPDPASYKDENYGPKLKRRRPVDALPSNDRNNDEDRSMSLVLFDANRRLARMTGENAEQQAVVPPKTGLGVFMKLKQHPALRATIDHSGNGYLKMLTAVQNMYPDRHTDDLCRDLGIDHVAENLYRPTEQEKRRLQRRQDEADIEAVDRAEANAAAAFDDDDDGVTRTGYENDADASRMTIVRPNRVPKNILVQQQLDKQAKKKTNKKQRQSGGLKAASMGEVRKAIGAMRRSNQ